MATCSVASVNVNDLGLDADISLISSVVNANVDVNCSKVRVVCVGACVVACSLVEAAVELEVATCSVAT